MIRVPTPESSTSKERGAFSKGPVLSEREQDWAQTAVPSSFQTSMAASEVALLTCRTTSTSRVPRGEVEDGGGESAG
jgi:hypothetical protein